MNSIEMKSILNSLEDKFISNLAHPDGGKITKSLINDIKCEAVDEKCIVFSNKEQKFVVIALFRSNDKPVFPSKEIELFSGKNFPDKDEVSKLFIPGIIDWIIEKENTLTSAQKNELINFLPVWKKNRAKDPENNKKIIEFNALKKELEEKGLI